MFAVGGEQVECAKYLEEHQRLIGNLQKQRQTPTDAWLAKFQQIAAEEPRMPLERKLVFACMSDNLQTCWHSLLDQLELRRLLLVETSAFYARAQSLGVALNKADEFVASERRTLLEDGQAKNARRYQKVIGELQRLNQTASERHHEARASQKRLLRLIEGIVAGNLSDSRPNHLEPEGQNLANYIASYLEPFERRRLQLESAITSSRTSTNTNNLTGDQAAPGGILTATSGGTNRTTTSTSTQNININTSTNTSTRTVMREITSFDDLKLAENWLASKVEQLNSSLLSSLGLGAQDSRSILRKHEQIALECSAIEEATLNFKGKNIHAVKSVEQDEQQGNLSGQEREKLALFERQRKLATRTRDVITILDARVVLLRRTIDFYVRAREAETDLAAMLRRLQVDDSLQSVQVVASELELKDVSAVVASGATVLSELQQLQLAQKHGQRSDIVNLNLVTSGVRAVIDKLAQELGQLKTTLNQRRLVLMNEDAAKRTANFANKCHQLQFWLDNHVKSHLLANQRVPVSAELTHNFCLTHEQLQSALQNKSLEVEALIRLLATLPSTPDPKTNSIQRETESLRQDWIRTSACLDRRIDLIRKYHAFLVEAASLSSLLEVLEIQRLNPEPEFDAKQQQAHQQLMQLAQKADELAAEAPRLNTALAVDSPSGGQVTSDLEKQRLVDLAGKLIDSLGRRAQLLQGLPLVAVDEEVDILSGTRRSPRGVTAPRAPRFTRPLVDLEAEPFSTVELSCATEPEESCQVDWLMNNKRIPPNVKHSTASDGNQHKLTIRHFGPTCCGLYTARATNASGLTASTQCRLRLTGIKEAAEETQQQTQQQTSTRGNPKTLTETTTERRHQTQTRRPIEQIVRGVDSREGSPASTLPLYSRNPISPTNSRQMPISQSTYSGRETTTSAASQQLNVPCVVSPASSSQSPFEGTPQAPVFAQPLSDSVPHCCSRAGLVCLVVANPPATIEWLHNNTPIATTKCPRQSTGVGGSAQRGNICKLTIETVSPRTQGNYVCRATNRLGQAASEFQLSK